MPYCTPEFSYLDTNGSFVHFVGHIEWADKTRKRCLLVWRTPEEWGKLIYSWVSFCLSYCISLLELRTVIIIYRLWYHMEEWKREFKVSTVPIDVNWSLKL